VIQLFPKCIVFLVPVVLFCEFQKKGVCARVDFSDLVVKRIEHAAVLPELGWNVTPIISHTVVEDWRMCFLGPKANSRHTNIRAILAGFTFSQNKIRQFVYPPYCARTFFD
jgi:hypothetical protein